MNGSHTLPRELIKWLDSLDLAYSIRNVRRDLANGFIIAQILSRFYPKEVNIYTYDNGLKVQKKKDNWQQIAKVLGKKEFVVTSLDYQPIYFQAPDVAYNFLVKLYEFLAKKKLQANQVPKPVVIVQQKPGFAKPTATMLARDRQLTRIVDKDQKKLLTWKAIKDHNEKMRTEKMDSNIIDYLIQKRRKEIEEQIRREQQEMLARKQKYRIADSMQAEVKEIELKAYHSSTSKKSKESQGQVIETKGVIEFLQEQSRNLLKKDPTILKDIKQLPKNEKTNVVMDENSPTIILELFKRCNEKYGDKPLVTKQTLKILIAFFEENFFQDNHLNIVNTVNNNFLDFKKFFMMFYNALSYYKPSSKTLLNIVSLCKKVASELVLLEPHGTQMMFEQILLKELIGIIQQYPNQTQQLCELSFYFVMPDSISRHQLIKKYQEILGTDISTFTSILSHLITLNYDDFDDDLYQLFFYYAVHALNSPSPFNKANGLKILYELIAYNYQPVLTKLDQIGKLVNDKWWEVLAEILIICSELLLYLAEDGYQNPSVRSQQNRVGGGGGQNYNGEDGGEENEGGQLEEMEETKSVNSEGHNLHIQNQKQIKQERKKYTEILMNIIYHIFNENNSQNILRIGLIYMAPALNFYQSLCDRYLSILLTISEKIRQSVLETDTVKGMEIDQVVRGYASFRYKLTSAPLNWNSVGIAQAMDRYVSVTKLQRFQREHLVILKGCLYKSLETKDAQTWLQIYENLKMHIFLAFLERENCDLASEILQKIFLYDAIQKEVMTSSHQLFQKLLVQIYHPDIDPFCQDTLLDFLEFLNSSSETFKKYTYDIIREFSQKNINLFLKSNLIDFMNNLARERKTALFPDVMVDKK